MQLESLVFNWEFIEDKFQINRQSELYVTAFRYDLTDSSGNCVAINKRAGRALTSLSISEMSLEEREYPIPITSAMLGFRERTKQISYDFTSR